MVNWEKHEKDVQERLELDSTIASGSKWYDIGDATSNTNHQDDNFPIVLDCKATEKKSYRLDRRLLEDWRKRAITQGKRFLLPIRFVNEGEEYDWCTLHLDDLAELLYLAREAKTQMDEKSGESEELPDEVSNALFDLYSVIAEDESATRRVEMFELFEVIEAYCKGVEKCP